MVYVTPESEPRGQGRAPGHDLADAQWFGFSSPAPAVDCQASQSWLAEIHLTAS